ncbi:MAG: chemotaxis protein CheW [Methylococcales bacterium]|nr:chemotaxis protein CheW [Methylococcales bacterium]
MHSEKNEQKVVHQEIALDTYLSTLLDEIPDDILVDQDEEKKVETVVKNKTEKNVEQQARIKSKELSVKTVNPLTIMPDWSQHEFQVLFFKVDKLILATPLTDLLRTIKIDDSPTSIPGQPSWFMGLLDTHDQRIGVLDTGQLIFGKNKGQQRDLEIQPFESILITHDGKWGLACDEILSIGKLEPEKVRWRTLRKKRPWLVGTVIEELTAVIDVNQLVPHRKTEI